MLSLVLLYTAAVIVHGQNEGPMRNESLTLKPAMTPQMNDTGVGSIEEEVRKILESASCLQRRDGNQADPTTKCSHYFVSCSNGQGSVRRCPQNMFYDYKVDKCDIYAYVPACSRKSRPMTTTMKPEINVLKSTTAHPLFDCRHVRDGEYPDHRTNCSSVWFSCLAGHTSVLECPKDQYYDVANKRCDKWINVYGCSGVEQVSTTKGPSDHSTVEPVPIDCERLADGFYSNPQDPCSQVLFSCSNGNGRRQKCPGSLYYNPGKESCDSYSNIYECTGVLPTEAAPTTESPPTKAPVVYPFKCVDRADGNYAASKCENHYWQCSNGVTHKMPCGENLYYNEDMNECDLAMYVIGCGGVPRTTAGPANTTMAPAPVDFDCTKLSDGNYAAGGCERHFYSCSGSVARVMQCSENTRYDSHPMYQRCNKPEYIPNCGGARMKQPVLADEPSLQNATTKIPEVVEVKTVKNATKINNINY